MTVSQCAGFIVSRLDEAFVEFRVTLLATFGANETFLAIKVGFGTKFSGFQLTRQQSDALAGLRILKFVDTPRNVVGFGFNKLRDVFQIRNSAFLGSECQEISGDSRNEQESGDNMF